MATRKLNVRRSLERLLFPALEARGFVRHPPAERDNLRPFGPFTRASERGLDFFEIQFDKNNPAHFRVNLAVLRAEWKPGEAWICADQKHYYLTRWGLPLRRWFGVRKKASEGISEAEYDAAVEVLMRQMPHVDRLFATGRRAWRMAEMPEPRRVALVLIGFWILVAAVFVLAGFAALLFAVRGLSLGLRALFSG